MTSSPARRRRRYRKLLGQRHAALRQRQLPACQQSHGEGYLVDLQLPARNGRIYGWTKVNNQTRDWTRRCHRPAVRHAQPHAEERFHELGDGGSGRSVPGAVWGGDATAWDSTYKVNAEGVLAVNACPTSSSRWAEGTVTVTVTQADVRLTVANASGAVNNKICSWRSTR